jgi:hypothetical protein
VLTNWHYASGSEHSILVNEHDAHGQRRDAAGAVLPCDQFPLRAHRECLGCGCIHGAPNPRGVSALLREADAIRSAARRRADRPDD